MKDKVRNPLPEALTNLLDECFPRLPGGEFPRPPSLPRGGCFPQPEPRSPAPSTRRVKGRGKRK